jgi:hypothetical protein
VDHLNETEPLRSGSRQWPREHLQPATRVQFEPGAVLQHSRTPSLRVAGFEDENEAPGEKRLAQCLFNVTVDQSPVAALAKASEITGLPRDNFEVHEIPKEEFERLRSLTH